MHLCILYLGNVQCNIHFFIPLNVRNLFYNVYLFYNILQALSILRIIFYKLFINIQLYKAVTDDKYGTAPHQKVAHFKTVRNSPQTLENFFGK